MSGHPSTEMLARYAEGDLETRQARRIDDHLGGCPECSSVLADLSQVSELLASAPPPLPAAIAARLDAALAAAVAERATAGGSGEEDPAPAPMIPGRPDLPERSGRHQRRSRQPGRGAWRSSPLLLRGLAAAGAVVVLAGGGLLISRFSAASSSSALSSAPATSGAQHAAGTATAQSGAGAAVPKTAAPAFSAPGFWQFTYSRNGVPATTTLFTSGQDLGPATLRAEVEQTLATHAGKSDQGKGATGGIPTDQPRLTAGEFGVTSLRACVTLIAAGAEVRLIETARYQGVPVAIIVSASSPAARVLDVTVVGTGCSAANSDVIARTVVPAGP